VHYVIDEFGNLPKMEFIPKIYSLDRSKNIMALTVIQSRSQLLNNYGEHATKELLDSAQAIILCSITDASFAEELSQRGGTSKKESVSKSTGPDGKVSTSTSESEQKNLNGADLMNKKTNEYIVFLAQKRPYKFSFDKFWETDLGKGIYKNHTSRLDYGVIFNDRVIDIYENCLTSAIKKE
jgi:type IV secretory pathway TraG/TraD family ATPase VirD4